MFFPFLKQSAPLRELILCSVWLLLLHCEPPKHGRLEDNVLLSHSNVLGVDQYIHTKGILLGSLCSAEYCSYSRISLRLPCEDGLAWPCGMLSDTLTRGTSCEA